MKLFIDNPLTCPCSSPRLYLHDMRLHQEGSFGHGFHLSIYFYCPDCQRLGDSVPQETANKLIDGLSDVLAFLREATDRQPALLKPSPNTTTSSGGYTTTTPPMP